MYPELFQVLDMAGQSDDTLRCDLCFSVNHVDYVNSLFKEEIYMQ